MSLISKRHIEIVTQAETLSYEYLKLKGFEDIKKTRIDIEDFYTNIYYPKYDFEMHSCDLGFHNNQKVLGKTIIEERLIILDNSLENSPRKTFTEAHEFGHGILHANNPVSYYCSQDTINSKQLQNQIELEINRREREANIFAVNLVMPTVFTRIMFKKCYSHPNCCFSYSGSKDYNFYIWNLREKIFIESFTHFVFELAKSLVFHFSDISYQALGFRLLELGLINNETNERIDFDTFYKNGGTDRIENDQRILETIMKLKKDKDIKNKSSSIF